MKTASAKAKARKLQQLVRDKILALFPSLTLRDVVSAPMGVTGVDVQLSNDAFTKFMYKVECKAGKRFKTLYKDFKQHDAVPGEPLLVIRGDHEQALAVVTLDHLMRLIDGNRRNK